MNKEPIRAWRGEHWFLDNSYDVPIGFEGLMFPSVTHAFAAAQAPTLDLRIEISKAPLTDLEEIFKKIGEPPDGFRGPDIMRRLLEYKYGFSNFTSSLLPHQSKLAIKLLVTGRRPLVYGNMVCNDFWGDCGCPKHLNIRGKNVLGGLVMGVRDRIIEKLTMGIAKDQTCSCEHVNESFFLYTMNKKLHLKPFCEDCQPHCAIMLAKLSDNNEVNRFDKEWFREEKGNATTAKKPANRQIIAVTQTIHPVFTDKYNDELEDEDYNNRWEALAWMGHLGPKKDEPKLAKNITYYLSGRIS